MKIVVLGTRGIPNIQGGVEKHCENLYPLLAKKGHNITILARKPYVAEKSNYCGIAIIPVSCPKNKYFEAFMHTFFGIMKAKQLAPDILHIHAIGPALFTPLARSLGMKVVMTHHGPDYERKKWPWFAKLVLRAAEAIGAWSANEIICVSEYIAAGIKKKYKRRSTVIPNGVSVTRPPTGTGLLNNYGLTEKKYILAVGRLVPEKGFHNLIDAFKCVSPPGWKLIIVGDADHEDAYSRRLKQEAAQDPRIILAGFLSSEPLAILYNYAGLFASSSYHEGLPLVLLEALSFGVACIASDIPGNRNIGLNMNNFFPPDDIDALANKISYHINNPLSDAQRLELITTVRQRYDLNEIAKKTLEVYNSVIQNEPVAGL